MENLLLAQLREALPQGMRVPSELEALYAWIDEREGGTDIVFFTDEPKIATRS